jgi:hypothetical protein
MAKKNGSERSLSLWNDQIRRDRPTFWAGVGDVVKTPAVEFFDDPVMDIERRLGVVIEEVVRCFEIGRGLGRARNPTCQCHQQQRFTDHATRNSNQQRVEIL